MRNFIEKFNVVKQIREKIDERKRWENYSSYLPISDNNIIIENNIVEEEEKIFKEFPFSKEGCRGEYYDDEYDDEVEYVSYFKYLVGKKFELIKKDGMLKINSWINACSEKIKADKKNISSIKNLNFNGTIKRVQDGFNVIKKSFSFKKSNQPKIEISKLSQSDGDVVYNWPENFNNGNKYVIDRTNQSKVAIVLNEGIKFLKNIRLIKENKFTRYIEKRATADIRLVNAHDAYFIDKSDMRDDVVWYYPEKNNNTQVKVKKNDIVSILNLHKPQNQAYLVKGLTAASLTIVIGLGCAYPVGGFVSKVNEFLYSKSDSKQVLSVEKEKFDSDDYIMMKTYGDAYDINTKMVNFEYYKRHTSSTMNKKVTLESEVSNIDSNLICIGDCVTTNSNTIYKGISDASDKVNGLKAAYSCDKVREVELIGLDYEGKIIYSSDQKVIDEYRMKGAVDTAYLTYVDNMCEGYYSSDNVKKLVKKL